MMSKHWILACLIPLLLTGCAGSRYLMAEPGERLVVTAGYDPAVTYPRQKGDDFVFSFIPPTDVGWQYTESRWALLGSYEPDKNRGYITVYGASDFHNSITLDWVWLNAVGVRSALKGRPAAWAGVPWYKDIVPEIGLRVPYVPKKHEIQGKDWYRLGYPQGLFTDYMTKGAEGFYCRRSVYTRSGTADWNEDEQVVTVRAENTGFNVVYGCPFRLVDGRNVVFFIRTGFGISGQELASNPNALEEQLDRLDRWLEPTWQSLIIMPGAYQFDPPEGAQQSMFCETHGYCW